MNFRTLLDIDDIDSILDRGNFGILVSRGLHFKLICLRCRRVSNIVLDTLQCQGLPSERLLQSLLHEESCPSLTLQEVECKTEVPRSHEILKGGL